MVPKTRGQTLTEKDGIQGTQMTKSKARKLHRGDEVTWNDLDNGICTRTLTILEIQWQNDIATITDTEGNELQAFASELS
jgi:hypothetical protein